MHVEQAELVTEVGAVGPGQLGTGRPPSLPQEVAGVIPDNYNCNHLPRVQVLLNLLVVR